MTGDQAKNKNLLLIESSLAIASKKLVRAVLSGASGVIVVRVPFRKGGVRDITIGEELSVCDRHVDG